MNMNPQQMMKQARKMQKQMEEVQDQLIEQERTGGQLAKTHHQEL